MIRACVLASTGDSKTRMQGTVLASRRALMKEIRMQGTLLTCSFFRLDQNDRFAILLRIDAARFDAVCCRDKGVEVCAFKHVLVHVLPWCDTSPDLACSLEVKLH